MPPNHPQNFRNRCQDAAAVRPTLEMFIGERAHRISGDFHLTAAIDPEAGKDVQHSSEHGAFQQRAIVAEREVGAPRMTIRRRESCGRRS